MRNRYLTEANNDLVRVESGLGQTGQNALARADAFKGKVIRSPMKGNVENVQTTTIGRANKSGQNILEIIRANDELLVEAYVKPAEVAFLQIGQPAVVKLTAYDFNRVVDVIAAKVPDKRGDPDRADQVLRSH